MNKNIILIIILWIAVYLVPANAQNTQLYSIQLGVFTEGKFADSYIEQLEERGMDGVYRINTSMHHVFYGIYTNKDQALQDLDTARQFVSGAFVARLTDNEAAAYQENFGTDLEKAVAALSENVTISTESSTNESDTESEAKSGNHDESEEMSAVLSDDEKQITINETPAGSLEYTYRVVNDIELIGVNGESKWFFEVAKGMEVKNFQFNLFSRVNELIRTDLSYFTVYMNDVPIQSMKIKEANNELINSWAIDIPINLIHEGYNELKIKTYSRISDRPCEDDKNIANWVIIDGNTNYTITYSKTLTASDISDFPSPFVGMYPDDTKGIGIVIPDDYTDQEISAALTLIAHMKSYYSSYEVSASLVTTGDPSISQFDSLIYVGKYEGVPTELKSTIKNQADLYINDANIYRSTLDEGEKPVFLIISDNGDRLIEAVKALNNSDLKAQMLGNYIMLRSNLDTSIKEKTTEDYIYLSDLGINGIEINGRNQQVANIGLRIPVNQILANESSINLKIRYSDNLDFEKSMVSVYVNGIPIGSEKLEREKRDLHTMTFYMPETLRTYNYYDVRIVFDLIPSGIIDCERYLASVPWAYINEDSYYFFPTEERRLMLFNNLPFPFSRDEDLDSTTIVIPDHPTREDYKIAGRIAELTGIGVNNNEGIINLVKGSMMDRQIHGNNLIIFGTPEENSAIKKINSNLWFRYDGNFNNILSNEKVEVLPETSDSATFFELKKSPFNEDKGMMTITSLDKESITKAIEFLKDNKRGLLMGDAVIISENGDLMHYRFQKEEEKRPAIEITQGMTKGLRDYIIFIGAVGAFLIISLGFYIFKNRRNR